ncbi:hypothetical protein HQQ80_18905 [Microbacteriaceae bacterium VKM Ac-2855]|nr:hypothetical protein [Microbacteriaceae bacterium VKM Ac-2855]
MVAIAFILWRFNIDSLWRRVRSASSTAKIFECFLSDETAAALKKVIGPSSFRLGQGYVITADETGITFYGHGAPTETAGTLRWIDVVAMASGPIRANETHWIGVTIEVAKHGGVLVPLLIRPTGAFAGVRRGDHATSGRALRAFEALRATSTASAVEP